ncbi:MAG: glycosyltransferase family 4 protein [Planctomycetes bacterium]|nr:glycosyltransferase family 4 protein [Planctomycetota bacterium]
MKHPRVLVLTHSLSPVDGVGVYAVQTLRSLAPLCAGIELFIGREHRGVAEDMPRVGVTLYETLPTNHFPFMPLPKLAYVTLSSLPTLVRAAARADVVHSFADYPMGFLAVLVARLARKPVVVSGHGTYSVAPLDMRVHGTLIRWMFRRTDRFLMGARYALDQVERRVRPNGAEVVPYGCVPGDYESWAARGAEPGVPGPYVLCVGEVKERKGYETSLPAFLAAWRRRPEMHYAIVGRFAEDDRYYQGLLRQVREAGAEQHVHFLGNVESAHKVALMRGARAFMLTPKKSAEGGFEAFGLVFLEAGAAGAPVVGVTDSGAVDAITDGSNGFIRDRSDVEGLADALVRLFADDELAERMGRAGRERALGQTWEHAARRVRTIYGELLGGEYVLPEAQRVPARVVAEATP